jgi:serine/threonine protein kinase
MDRIRFAKPASEDKDMHSLKLLDFGFAKHINDDGKTSSSRGTPQYVAPEVVFKNKKGKIEYGTSCDMWSLGNNSRYFRGIL